MDKSGFANDDRRMRCCERILLAFLVGAVLLTGGCASSSSSSDRPRATRSVAGIVEVPPESGLKVEEAVVYTPRGSATVEANGQFTVKVDAQGVTAVSIIFPNGLIMLDITVGSSRASPLDLDWDPLQEMSTAGGNRCTLRTTAESLLFLNIALFSPDPAEATRVLSYIRASPATSRFEEVLARFASQTDPLEQPEVRAAYQEALRSILSGLATASLLGHNDSASPVAQSVAYLPAIVSEPAAASTQFSVQGIDLEWIELSNAQVQRSGDWYVIRPRNTPTNPTLWLVWLNELDPQVYPGSFESFNALRPTITNTSVLKYRDDGVRASGVVAANRSIWGYIDVVGLIIESVVELASGWLRSDDGLRIPATRSGVYELMMTSGGIAAGPYNYPPGELSTMASMYRSNEPQKSALYQSGIAYSLNLFRAVLSGFSAVVDVSSLRRPEKINVLRSSILASAQAYVNAGGRVSRELFLELLKGFADVTVEILADALETKARTIIKYYSVVGAALGAIANVGELGSIMGQLMRRESPMERAVIVVQTPPPAVPSGLRASQGDAADRIQVSWSRTTGAQSYTVLRSSTAQGEYVVVQQGLSGTSWTDSGLKPDTHYWYRVQACADGKCSNPSAPVEGWTKAASLPVPTGLTASQGTYVDRVALSWNAVSGAASYKVHRSTSSSQAGEVVATVSTTSWNDTGAVQGTRYWYRVTACSRSGECSSASAPVEGWRGSSGGGTGGSVIGTWIGTTSFSLTVTATEGGRTQTERVTATARLQIRVETATSSSVTGQLRWLQMTVGGESIDMSRLPSGPIRGTWVDPVLTLSENNSKTETVEGVRITVNGSSNLTLRKSGSQLNGSGSMRVTVDARELATGRTVSLVMEGSFSNVSLQKDG